MTNESDEEMLIMVDMHGIIESDWETHIGSKCKIVGIDTEEPLLQLDRYIFTGKYEDIPGTALLFEGGDTRGDEEANRIYKYRYRTHKRLVMRRAFLKEKDPEEERKSEDQKGDGSKSDQNPSKTNTVVDSEPAECHNIQPTEHCTDLSHCDQVQTSPSQCEPCHTNSSCSNQPPMNPVDFVSESAQPPSRTLEMEISSEGS